MASQTGEGDVIYRSRRSVRIMYITYSSCLSFLMRMVSGRHDGGSEATRFSNPNSEDNGDTGLIRVACYRDFNLSLSS